MARFTKSQLQSDDVALELKPVARAGTKSATLVSLLKRKQGVSIAEMISATGMAGAFGARLSRRHTEKAPRAAADHNPEQIR